LQLQTLTLLLLTALKLELLLLPNLQLLEVTLLILLQLRSELKIPLFAVVSFLTELRLRRLLKLTLWLPEFNYFRSQQVFSI
jgi:hypothetical protein